MVPGAEATTVSYRVIQLPPLKFPKGRSAIHPHHRLATW